MYCCRLYCSYCTAALLPCHAQVYVGDFIQIDMGDENAKGWSVAQVEELYQTPDVSSMYCRVPLRRRTAAPLRGEGRAAVLPPRRVPALGPRRSQLCQAEAEEEPAHGAAVAGWARARSTPGSGSDDSLSADSPTADLPLF
jgi:hypothetical protein